MTSSLAERLEKARQQQFVGRQTEQALIQAALTAAEPPFMLLYLFGPGGVGKTSLLRAAAQMAQAQAIPTVTLDSRNVEPSPTGFLQLLQQQLNCPTTEAIFPTLAAQPGRLLLLIDTAELLSPLDSWLRDNFLPQLPAQVLVIIAGRNPPSLRWRTDPGWQQVMKVQPLQNLTPQESRTLLMGRQVPEQEYEAVLRFTHGHPLALSLVADLFAQRPGTRFRPEEAPNVIKTLLEQLMEEAPSPIHRTALEACSQVRLLSEPLLGAMLAIDEPHTIFEWLRSLSFIEADRRGLFPHDLAREALAADLQWRNPSKQVLLHDRARVYYITRFHESDPQEQRQVLADYIFLHRDNPMIRSYFEWQSTGTVFTDGYRPEDREPVLEMVRQHEGDAAAGLTDYWLDRQPQGLLIMREASGTPAGLLFMIAIDKTTAAERAMDPGAAAAWDYLVQYAPLRPGEVATLFRFWMARDTYQAVSPIQSLIFLNMVQHYLTAPHLAFTLLPCAEPDFWRLVFGFADLHRLPEANFQVGEQTFGMYGHDWRTVPPLLWLGAMAERELGRTIAVPPLPNQTTPFAVLLFDEKGFAAAVHDALRDYTDTVALANNPLLQSHLLHKTIPQDTPTPQRIKALQNLLKDAAASLQDSPRQMKLYRALYQTYFQPAATQEKAAELLDLPFSTYRRHLRSGIDYVTERLWQQEHSDTSR